MKCSTFHKPQASSLLFHRLHFTVNTHDICIEESPYEERIYYKQRAHKVGVVEVDLQRRQDFHMRLFARLTLLLLYVCMYVCMYVRAHYYY
jgi:hypothetical protein